MKIEKKIIRKKLSFAEIEFEIEPIGEDILILIRGGDVHHIGSCVMSIPRPSLKDNENELKKRLIVNICIFILMWIVTIVLLYMKKNF